VEYLRDYLSAALDHVRTGIKAGQSKEEIAKAASLKGFDDVHRSTRASALPVCSILPTTNWRRNSRAERTGDKMSCL
jgi:hypothetical protein